MSAGNATREPLPTTALSPPATTPTAMSATRASTKAPAVISGISAPERTQRVAHVSDVLGDGRTRGHLVACDDRIENRLMLTSRTVQAALELEARATGLIEMLVKLAEQIDQERTAARRGEIGRAHV